MATLSDLQTEREKLRALTARTDYESALAETVSHKDVLDQAAELRRLVAQTMGIMPGLLAQAVAGEHDETRVHYLMADIAHTVLTDMGAHAEATITTLPKASTQFKRGVQPRDLLTVSQWADRHRWLRSGTNAPGRWDTALTPYLREVMDSLSEHSPVRTVVFKKSTGVGASEAMMNWIGYTMHHLQNKDMLVVMPTLELRDRSLNPRMAKMLDESEALHGLVTKSTRDKANRAEVVEYGAHARIIRSGANSPDSLRSDHLPYVICDEVSAYPWDVGGEGDPMTLIENRQRTYSRAKSYFISTPTTTGRCRISLQFARSDQRHYHVPCPRCEKLQVLEFDRSGTADHGLKWHATAPVDAETGEVMRQYVMSAWYVCKHCHYEIQESSKTDMLAHGRWIPARPNIKRVRGYHINALYAPVGLGTSWRDIAQKWIDSQGDTSELKAFVNTYLGETWAEQGDSIEDISLISRLEPYEPHALPYRLITAGVDVQKNRLEASIVGWGEKEEAWLIDHVIVPGDTTQADVWAELGEALAQHHVRMAAIDAGYNTSAVYAFCANKRWAVPCKGIGGTGRPLIEDERKRAARLRRRVRRQHAAEPIGVDQGKALIYARLKLEKSGPGYIHFPREAAFDDEYFAQLAAEKLVTKVRGTRPFQEWVQLRPRNEALDCLVYNFAAMRLSRVSLDAPAPAPAQPDTTDTPKPTARPARRRVVSRAINR
ncbi:phage terminase large subunit family protein [Castellaniella sp. S9]|uniref:phage terminase large subunit family protein n=1 Tax=Castellaniella sp. S9 TaxID=2993652 RepID=UPI0022B555FA|nr:terminase gpA endonuclease subunit [Castellaniella sp. S9]